MSEHVERFRIRAREWTDAENAAEILWETKNDVFAEIKSKMNGNSEAERDRMARLSPEWKEHRNKMLQARHDARVARMAMKHAEMLFSEWQTESANARQEKARY